MKIRNGFVSNSSSSSFIINGDAYANIFELTKVMIKQVEYKEQIDIILDRLDKTKKDPNTPVMFYSCNYDTYISKQGDFYFIDTCNNEDWDLKGVTSLMSLITKDPELYNKVTGGYDEIDFEKIHSDLKFWNVERDFMFKEQEGHNWVFCQRKDSDGKRLCGYSTMVIINNELQCPYCFHLENGKPSRYLLYKDRDKKLERINKSI